MMSEDIAAVVKALFESGVESVTVKIFTERDLHSAEMLDRGEACFRLHKRSCSRHRRSGRS